MNSKKQKKLQFYKKTFCYYPYNLEIKIIVAENIIEYLKKRVNLIFTFNSQTKKSIKFGINRIIKYTNKSTNEIIAFIFYKEDFLTLYSLLLLKCKENKKIKIYFIEPEYNKEFLELFRLKKCMGFLILKTQANEKPFNEILSNINQSEIISKLEV